MSDIENMDIMLGENQYNQIKRDLDQMTGFSNDFDRVKIEKYLCKKELISGDRHQRYAS